MLKSSPAYYKGCGMRFFKLVGIGPSLEYLKGKDTVSIFAVMKTTFRLL